MKNLTLVSFQLFTSLLSSGNWFNTCIEAPWVYECPSPKHTYLRCFSRKLPLSATASSAANVAREYTELSLVVIPGDSLFCKVQCMTEKNVPTKQEFCKPEYFSVGATKGRLGAVEAASDSGAVSFFYFPPDDIEAYADGSSAVVSARLGSTLVLQGEQRVVFPPFIASESSLTCDFHYVRRDQSVDCFVTPKNAQKAEVSASPFEFDLALGEGYSEEVGRFALGSYLALKEIGGTELKFQCIFL